MALGSITLAAVPGTVLPLAGSLAWGLGGVVALITARSVALRVRAARHDRAQRAAYAGGREQHLADLERATERPTAPMAVVSQSAPGAVTAEATVGTPAEAASEAASEAMEVVQDSEALERLEAVEAAWAAKQAGLAAAEVASEHTESVAPVADYEEVCLACRWVLNEHADAVVPRQTRQTVTLERLCDEHRTALGVAFRHDTAMIGEVLLHLLPTLRRLERDNLERDNLERDDQQP